MRHPWSSGDRGFFVDRIGRFLLLAVFALSVDLIWGYGGMFTFGQAAFFGGAGYAVGILSTREAGILPLPLGVAIVGAVAASALLALAISYFTFARRGGLRGVEFAVVTLAVSVALERLANAGGPITGGQNGILMTYRLGPLHQGHGFYLLAAVDPRRHLSRRSSATSAPAPAWSFGESARTRSGSNFSATTSLASSAGPLSFPEPSPGWRAACSICTRASSRRRRWESAASTLVLLWVVLGGKGTLIGPVVGAVALPYLTARLSGTLLDTWLVVVGVILVAVILLIPAGIFGFLNRERAS